MTITQFDRDSLANWYATQHLRTDPGIRQIFYLPNDASEREIRLVEINELIGERTDDALEPIDFGIDRGMDSEHQLLVLDITPGQWERIHQGQLSLPASWTLEGAVPLPKSNS